ncbi:hypothetical protein K491DRAFT_510760 [Lophiostoma macrostomum CBS 122681]|uniref:Uncharacterized protein n=1 Tax=Lophiostoma macrostomum CBS 122681 TaxID=1314788 RepID=A0A6A6T310_9PLEO|nr:hypothetical protein K491DRAFT_510760 [Lophiostoma macrostomum CBS 122681]
MGFSLLMDAPQVLAYPTPEPEFLDGKGHPDTKALINGSPEQSVSKQARGPVSDKIHHEDDLACPPFPKPLALSFRNFDRYYKTYAYSDGERMEVANRLVASFLGCYFPKSTFDFRRLPYGIDPLVETLKVKGTLYWWVTRNDSQDTPYLVLFVIATEPAFLERPERTAPRALQLSLSTIDEVGQIEAYERGHVVILGGKMGPLCPTLEFYSFTDGGERKDLMPWFGKTTLCTDDFGTNSFSLSFSEAERIHQMFKRIEGCSTGDRPLNPIIELVSPTPKTGCPTPSSNARNELSRFNGRSEESDTHIREYLQGLRMNKAGKVFESYTGHFLKKDKTEEAKELAARLGFTIAPPKGRKPTRSGARVDLQR